MSARGGTRGGDGLFRLSLDEVRARREADGLPRYTVVGADGQAVPPAVGLEIARLEPLRPPPIVLPVSVTAAELQLRAEGDATAFAIQGRYEQERGQLRVRLGGERAEKLVRHAEARRARRVLVDELEARREFVEGLPRRLRRLLRRRLSRLFRWVPWSLWAADTMFISRAYGLLGPLPLPFPTSVGVTNATQVARAALVSFGLVFGLRLAGSKVKELVDELRERRGWLAMLFDAAVAATVVATAVGLALATAKMQAALLAVESGGSQLQLPTSVLFAIGAFLGSISFACGYYLNEPELEQAADHDRRVDAAEAAVEQAEAAFHRQLGVVQATRAELTSLDAHETVELAENGAHTDGRVYAHKAGNVLLYGLEAGPAGAAPAERSGR